MEIELEDGTILEAPDDADPSVIAKNYLSSQGKLQQPQERSFAEDLGRAAKMQGIEAAKGAVNFVMMPIDAVNELIGFVKNASGGNFSIDPLRSSPDNPSKAITDPLTEMQPQPENTSERFATRIAGALGSGGAGIAAGRALPGAISALAQEPARQAAGIAGSSAASQAVSEAGGGQVAETIAGLAGGMVAAGPALSGVAGATKRTFRGGEDGRKTVAENIKTFEDAGSFPSVGQATQNRRTQASETLLSRAPGGAGVMAKSAEKKSAELGAGLEKQASKLSPKSSGEQAGREISRGISDDGGFVDTFKTTAGKLYDKIDEHIKPGSPVKVTNTIKALDELTKVTKGAEATTGRLVNKRISEIKQDLLTDAKDGVIPYEALKAIRTRVGEEIANSALQGDVPTAQWKRLYASLSSDLEAAAKSAGPNAEGAYKRANAYYSAGSQRLDVLQSVIDKNGGPEAIFRAATSGSKEGATTLRAVMQSLPDGAQKTVSATVLRRLGRAKPGQQDDLGEAFSTETFLTNWNSISPEAKRTLFDRYGPTFRRDMDQIARVASNLRDGSQVFRNPSGAAQGVIQQWTAGAFVLSVVTGQIGQSVSIASGVTGANLSARLLTNQNFVRWLAKTTRKPVEALPVLINELAESKNPLLQEAAEELKQAHDYEKEQRKGESPKG